MKVWRLGMIVGWAAILIASVAVVRAQEGEKSPEAPTALDELLVEQGAEPSGDEPEVANEAPPAVAPASAAPANKPQRSPWKLMFFDNDFSYKKDPNHEHLLGEELKDIPLDQYGLFGFLPESTRFSTGGEVRFRQMDEVNRLPGAPARADYQLWRWRQYFDLKVDDFLRFYVEGIDASVDNKPTAVSGIDINRWDLQNALFDLRMFDFNDQGVWFRAGRQELSYGSQRLISPLDWANTRRNFEGFKFFTKGTDWDWDLWFTRPVNTATPGDGPVKVFGSHFDSPNLNHTFCGSWLTYKAVKEQTIDMYWIWDWNTQFMAYNFTGGNRNTFGSRWLRHFPVSEGITATRTWHGEVEGAYQCGNDFGKNVNAGFVVAGIGHTWNNLPWEPDFWVYDDYASGSNNINSGTSNTFAQQYGLVHAYLGQIDNIARQNINDINCKFTLKPTKKLSAQTQYHWFDLANTGDVLYTVTGQPFGKPNTGKHVGEELDFVTTYTFNPNFSVQAGYLYFWYGAMVENNSPRANAAQFYLMTTFSY